MSQESNGSTAALPRQVNRFLLTALPLMIGLHLFIGWRLLPDLDLNVAGWTASVAFLCVSSLMIPLGMAARFIVRSTELADRVHWLGTLLMGLFSSLLVLTLLRDIALLLTPTGWRHGLTLAVLGLTSFVTLVGYVNARRIPRVAHVAVPIAGLPEPLHGFTIAQITDLHVGPTIKQSYVAGVVARLNSLGPDLVAVTGDLVDGDVEVLRLHIEPLSNMRARHGVFAVTGNHEYYSGVAQWVPEFERLGMRVLMNEHAVVEHGGAALVVAGVTDFSAGKFDAAQTSDPARALSGAPGGLVPAILLAHQPRSAQAAEEVGFHLQLSGHTHGGQFWPWNLFVPLQQPFTAGLHRLGRLWIYTSRGTGYWGPPLRFGAPSEITLLRLERASGVMTAGVAS
ncbi:metallophosphoesterase [Ralstonia pseudosolanacearum]|uniref:metallophosphoesterase n=1 Tax=Ralstonia pseudosolanacearum TaxID=1310165 RepID=UPI0002C045B5|nr:metallophosphoesterase [Ralstonia pseudosolanacearum]ANH36424.1 phosphoesterase [Ralstonia solanacearum]ESS51919.1 metallophosphoesterase protein [Ralstonia solanacearum SD54]AGH86306.1 putative phosphoesterase [Ralstonia pseudosolanacearum FQY_4]MCK4150023.1 metallophosphoesterase [Ralstonia pseudosolanacearum]BCL90011.1 calcineurin-like phosphoesterase [Ralstonia solanacearum]